MVGKQGMAEAISRRESGTRGSGMLGVVKGERKVLRCGLINGGGLLH